MKCASTAATPQPAVLDHMHALERGDWSIPDPLRRQVSGLIAADLQRHLERQLRTLPRESTEPAQSRVG
ncbi:hypothetical protein [Nocardia sp. NPDC050406]|uniref:hypothetical protein n=1 Tax=Nocardia sp. NPDC050406 TaxID=3364318 RepID=UPI00378898D5